MSACASCICSVDILRAECLQQGHHRICSVCSVPVDKARNPTRCGSHTYLTIQTWRLLFWSGQNKGTKQVNAELFTFCLILHAFVHKLGMFKLKKNNKIIIKSPLRPWRLLFFFSVLLLTCLGKLHLRSFYVNSCKLLILATLCSPTKTGSTCKTGSIKMRKNTWRVKMYNSDIIKTNNTNMNETQIQRWEMKNKYVNKNDYVGLWAIV